MKTATRILGTARTTVVYTSFRCGNERHAVNWDETSNYSCACVLPSTWRHQRLSPRLGSSAYNQGKRHWSAQLCVRVCCLLETCFQ